MCHMCAHAIVGNLHPQRRTHLCGLPCKDAIANTLYALGVLIAGCIGISQCMAVVEK